MITSPHLTNNAFCTHTHTRILHTRPHSHSAHTPTLAFCTHAHTRTCLQTKEYIYAIPAEVVTFITWSRPYTWYIMPMLVLVHLFFRITRTSTASTHQLALLWHDLLTSNSVLARSWLPPADSEFSDFFKLKFIQQLQFLTITSYRLLLVLIRPHVYLHVNEIWLTSKFCANVHCMCCLWWFSASLE